MGKKKFGRDASAVQANAAEAGLIYIDQRGDQTGFYRLFSASYPGGAGADNGNVKDNHNGSKTWLG
jgi:hypothetical protein